MDDQMWVGPDSRCPAGWQGCESLDVMLRLPGSPRKVVVIDRPATLRQADFDKLFGHAPLAKIERVVGPWRAGVGRTDPQWPLATTRRDDVLPDVNLPSTSDWCPLTSGYDDLAVEDSCPELQGLTFRVQINDAELSEMWVDWLTQSGGSLCETSQVDVLIRDSSNTRPETTVTAKLCLVTLSHDPWNAVAPASDCLFSRELVVSVLDSPARIMQRALSTSQRATL